VIASSSWLTTTGAQYSPGTGRCGLAHLTHYTAEYQEWGEGPPLVLVVVVHAASLHDRQGATIVWLRAKRLCPRLRVIWADSGYSGHLVRWVSSLCGWGLRIVQRSDVGFQVWPKRGIVERTFAWLTQARRLGKDYERLPASSEALIYIAMTRVMVRRLAAT